MKKVLLVAAVAGLSLVSCKKDYTCECVTTTNAPGIGTATQSTATGKMKKADAESKCNAGDQSTTVMTYNYKTECSIK